MGDYEALWQWSVAQPEAFWRSISDEFAISSDDGPVLSNPSMPGAEWFPEARLNYAEHALRDHGVSGAEPAILSVSQTTGTSELTFDDLREQVRRAAAGLERLGVTKGDRVAAYLPNIAETVVAFLATASLGAVWSSCAPEFGARSVLDRWSQVEPKVLLVVDGYRYGSKEIDLADRVEEIRQGLPTVETVVHLPYLKNTPLPDTTAWDDFTAPTDRGLSFELVEFAHPLYVLYSSGTTGLPKPIVHGHGGMLFEHTKQLGLQTNLGPGDRFFWFSTTGWMMWNYLVSGLLVGSSIITFDGNPGHPDLGVLWSVMADTKATFGGLSAPYIIACARERMEPAADYDLSSLRALGSTGAPLPESGFRWAHKAVGDMPLYSASGGTDVCTAFLGGAPVKEVLTGAIPCRQLGWAIDSFDASNNSVRNEVGELVITAPAPSMPVGFWGDDDGSKYRAAYFEEIEGVWRHGDWITIADDGSSVISGRSDATLNRGGVRLGTADFYDVVESEPEILDSLVIHLEDPDGGLGELLLFVSLAEGVALDEELQARIAARLRSDLSPRHVPDKAFAVPSIPRTLSGKKLEVPVKKILRGVAVDQAASKGSLADPKALDHFVDFVL